MICESTWDLLKPLDPCEIVFKKAYLLLDKHDKYKNLQKDLLQMGIKTNDYWLPYINSDQDTFMTQNLTNAVVGLDKKSVVICKHPRYQLFTMHRHEFYELIYVVRGISYHVVENHEFCIEQNEICIVPPYVRHMIGVFDDDSFVINFLFTREFLIDCILKLLFDEENIDILKFFNCSAYNKSLYDCIRINLKEDLHAHFLMEKMINENFMCKYTDFSLIKTTAINFLLYLCANCSSKSKLYDTMFFQNNKVASIVHFMQTNYREASLSNVAMHFHYAPAYLGRLLKKITGMSFLKLLRTIKIAQACFYLSTSQISVDEVARIVGYNSITYFNRIFKESVGMTPMELRSISQNSEFSAMLDKGRIDVPLEYFCL